MLSFIVGCVLHPVALIVIMWIVARRNAELHFLTAFLVVVGVVICTNWLFCLHPVAGVVGYIVVLPLALMRFCYLSLKQALIVTGILTVWLIVYEKGWELLLG